MAWDMRVRFAVSLCLMGFFVVGLGCFAGCASHKEAAKAGQEKAEPRIFNEKDEIAQAMQAAEDVLGKMDFEIEKADLQKGYIRTRPLAGAQFFEFWRSDNVGFKNQLLSNMHSIRRIVELNFQTQGKTVSMDCKVHVQRLSIPQHEITSSSRAYRLFTQSSVSLQRLELNPEQKTGMEWLNLDDDKKLEEEITKRISSTINKMNKAVSDKLQAEEEK